MTDTVANASAGTASSVMPRLKMAGITKRFGPTIALGGVSLAVHAGEVHALIGENGAGKSTLMKALSGAHQADTGAMWIDGPAVPAQESARRSRLWRGDDLPGTVARPAPLGHGKYCPWR